MAKAKTKKDHTASMIEAINKKFKNASVRRMADGAASAMREVIPTNLEVLNDWVFGVGGIPGNRIGEVFGDVDSGKTCLVEEFLGAAQRAGGLGILYETENTLDTERARTYCNIDEVVLAEPESADDVVDQMEALVDFVPKGVGPNIIVWDSLASASSRLAVQGKSEIGSIARTMSRRLPVISKKLADKRTAIVVVNQIRYKIGEMFGNPVTTPGGQTLKYMASWRLQLWKGKDIKEGTDVTGQYTTIKAIKNKVAYPHRKAVFKLDYANGWANEWTVTNFAKDRKLIPESTKQSGKAYRESIGLLKEMEGWYNGTR
jgi:recombination protein RecA